jgi:two-component system, sensor histidine kinase and response regulator
MSAIKSNSRASSLILVVDDDQSIRLMLRRVMQQEGYKVIEADNGEEGLNLYHTTHPDLILMDAMMPVMDGFETCARLQALPGGNRTPVLMITSLDDNESVDLAFKAGAIDFITKPIHWAVLRQRVARLLNSKQLEELRDDLTHMIVHDMKNPISSINGYADLLLNEINENLDKHQLDAASRIYRNSLVLLDMTMLILDLRRLEEGRVMLDYTEGNARDALQSVVDNLDWLATNRKVKLKIADVTDTLVATLDWSLLGRVLANLVTNAIKHSPRNTTVTLDARRGERLDAEGTSQPTLLMSVKDEGEGIAAADQVRIFDKFTQATMRKGGTRNDTGLGLTFCKLAVEAHNGTIQLESAVGVGSTFTIILPLEIEQTSPKV